MTRLHTADCSGLTRSRILRSCSTCEEVADPDRLIHIRLIHNIQYHHIRMKDINADHSLRIMELGAHRKSSSGFAWMAADNPCPSTLLDDINSTVFMIGTLYPIR